MSIGFHSKNTCGNGDECGILHGISRVLHSRQKWHIIRRVLGGGDLVTVISPDRSTENWPLGLEIDKIFDKDGLFREFTVKISKGILRRYKFVKFTGGFISMWLNICMIWVEGECCPLLHIYWFRNTSKLFYNVYIFIRYYFN